MVSRRRSFKEESPTSCVQADNGAVISAIDAEQPTVGASGMQALFYPRSIAVVGVSDSPENVGRMLMGNLTNYGFQGPIWAVGQDGGVIEGRPIYRSVLDVPKPVDVAAILVPAAAVQKVLEECGQAGVRWTIVLTSGFSELADEKQRVEDGLLAIADRYGMGLVGPNCVGVLNADNKLAATFFPLPVDKINAGPVGVIAQSGGVAVEMCMLLSGHKVGVAKYITLGNKLATNEAHALKYYLEEDPTVAQVAVYLESFADGRGFYDQARSSPKPIVLYKSNIVPGGSVAAKSHTAALSSDDVVVDAMCRQANIVRARNSQQFLSFSKALSLPPMPGNNVGIVVVSGGSGVLMSDYCYLHGFNVPELPDSVVKQIEQKTRTRAIKRGNPMDLGDSYDSSLPLFATECFLQESKIDGVLLCVPSHPEFPASGPSYASAVSKVSMLCARYKKPVAVSFSPLTHPLEAIHSQLDFPVFESPEEAVEALAVSRDYWHRRNRPPSTKPLLKVDRGRVRRIIGEALSSGRYELNEQAAGVLEAYGIPTERLRVASCVEEAVVVARELGYPVAMKVWSSQISHKSDVGGVALNLDNDMAVAAAYRRITRNAVAARPHARLLGVTIQKMVAEGREVIIGAKYDENFGPVVMFGSGGILVELLKDVSFRLAPIRRPDAIEMIDDVKSSRILRGFRGEDGCDVNAVVDALLRLSRLVVDFSDIVEVDVNPLKVMKVGSRAVDARIFLRNPKSDGRFHRGQADAASAKASRSVRPEEAFQSS